MPPTEDRRFSHDELSTCPLVIDAIYEGGTAGHAGDDPIGKILPVGNQGGFRYKGSPMRNDVRVIVLYTSGGETDWPDRLDPETGQFTYYGDNRTAGHELHDTRRKGNLLLRNIFEASHESPESRATVPPIFLFEKVGTGRDVRFRGLLVPGFKGLSQEEELVAVWRTTQRKRFQNYHAHFTVLDVATIERDWLDNIAAGRAREACPPAWRRWVQGRIYSPLAAPRTLQVRSKDEQLPQRPDEQAMLELIHGHFSPRPTEFEHFAAHLWTLQDPSVTAVDVTRASRDGGRDALGTYRIGPTTDPIEISFALEAKCYAPGRNSVGVREVARLISRLKHRDFGVLVTTSHIDRQTYQEVRADGHPVVFITGGDIIDILRKQGLRSVAEVQRMLQDDWPLAVEAPAANSPHVNRLSDETPLPDATEYVERRTQSAR